MTAAPLPGCGNNLDCWNEFQQHTCGINFVMTNPFEDDYEGGGNTNTNTNTNIEGGSIVNEQDDDRYSAEDEGEDLDALLNDMDIDKDFSMWKSFRVSISGSDSGDAVALPLDQDASEEAIQFWKERLLREEVYSKRYHPSKEEQQELHELATFVGLSRSSGFFTGLGRASGVLTGDHNMNLVEQLLQPGEGHPKSILLKRGPVLWKNQECELILLTHGFILATAQESKAKRTSVMFVQRTYETCQLWDQVEHATNYPERFCSFRVMCKGDESSSKMWEFQVDSVTSHTAWLNAIEKVLVQHALHHQTHVDTSQYGWQYQLMHRPGYTGAVTGNVNLVGSDDLNFNSLDTYQQMAPLHYALRQEKSNIPVTEALLLEGADPNFPDADGRTAMYYGTYSVFIWWSKRWKLHLQWMIEYWTHLIYILVVLLYDSRTK
jgi:hypothetical protein